MFLEADEGKEEQLKENLLPLAKSMKASPKSKDLNDMDLVKEYNDWLVSKKMRPNTNDEKIFLSELLYFEMKVRLMPDFFHSKDIGTFTHNLIYEILKSGKYKCSSFHRTLVFGNCLI